MEYAVEYIGRYGYIAISALLALGIVGLPIPDEMLMILVGYLASTKVLHFPLVLIFSFIGSVGGMTISYWVGRKLGLAILLRYGKWIGLTPKRYDRVRHWFQRYGRWTVLFSYFIPGVRHAAGYISGISAMPFRQYVLICMAGAVIWTVIFVSIGYFAGAHFLHHPPRM
ncbi:DedA family protein [Paenibacillus sp. WLX1005]|uniref:DedA family protein n=1 Tax=unclassified Paenibacillus TaxID=185978 RepID=UPI0039845947